jgi:hypothetical protein
MNACVGGTCGATVLKQQARQRKYNLSMRERELDLNQTSCYIFEAQSLDSVRTSQEIHYISATNSNWLRFRETIPIYD